MENFPLLRNSLETRFSNVGTDPSPPALPILPRHFFGIGSLLLLLILAYHLPAYFRRAPENILIRGNQTLSQETIVAHLKLPANRSWFAIDPFQLSLNLRTHPWIDKAVVHRTFPLTLDIFIVERVPIAMLKTADGLHLLGQDFLLLQKPAGDPIWDLPVITNLRLKKLRAGEYLPRLSTAKAFQLIALLKNDPVLPLAAVSEIDISDPFNLELVTRPDGIRLKWGFQDFERKLAALKVALPHLVSLQGNIDYIDLRYVRGVVLKKKR